MLLHSAVPTLAWNILCDQMAHICSFQHSRLYRWVKFNGYCGKVSKIKEELLSKEPSFIIMEEKNPHHYWVLILDI